MRCGHHPEIELTTPDITPGPEGPRADYGLCVACFPEYFFAKGTSRTDAQILAAFKAECDKVHIPYDPEGLVRHHRGNAGMAAAGEAYAEGWEAAVEKLRPQIKNIVDLLEAEPDSLANRVLELEKALGFYADPDSYFAIFIAPDRPAGSFADDFSDVDSSEFDYDRPMPGALAREVLGTELPQQRKKDYYG